MISWIILVEDGNLTFTKLSLQLSLRWINTMQNCLFVSFEVKLLITATTAILSVRKFPLVD